MCCNPPQPEAAAAFAHGQLATGQNHLTKEGPVCLARVWLSGIGSSIQVPAKRSSRTSTASPLLPRLRCRRWAPRGEPRTCASPTGVLAAARAACVGEAGVAPAPAAAAAVVVGAEGGGVGTAPAAPAAPAAAPAAPAAAPAAAAAAAAAVAAVAPAGCGAGAGVAAVAVLLAAAAAKAFGAILCNSACAPGPQSFTAGPGWEGPSRKSGVAELDFLILFFFYFGEK